MTLMGGMCPMDEAEAIDIVLLLGLMKNTSCAGHVFFHVQLAYGRLYFTKRIV